ncbi:hypothetical protein ACZ87_03491 [Candidatus Erwinia dacicola]|uniref:Uncharacterized protein n=1 Tax=Candidatus Erwinia dacicola TaxID=252393 RepID=A0A328TH34_9GAMM|nr:hypothetical protein ACZ87_03491 [Candidatus Erwinia dacicola]
MMRALRKGQKGIPGWGCKHSHGRIPEYLPQAEPQLQGGIAEGFL